MNTEKDFPEELEKKGKRKKDLIDHLDDFLEINIEKHFRKGLQELENFLKKEVLKQGVKRHHAPGPFSYIEAMLKDPKVASVAPSSKFLVERVLKMISWKNIRMVVEYGPAEGVITREILSRLPVNGRIVAVELNDRFISSLSQIQDPRLHVVHGSVMDIDKILSSLNINAGQVDTIISGIPFSFLKPVERHQLLHKTDDQLRPGGRFIAYQVTAHLLTLMKFHFPKVDVQYEVRNLPPNFVFTGFK